MNGDRYKQVFSNILVSKAWSSGETICGTGSKKENTSNIIKFLNKFIDENNVLSILDLGCGDLNWIGHTIETLQSYIGVDLGTQMLLENKEKFPNFVFQDQDILSFMKEYNKQGEKVEVIICRDVLVHLDNKYIGSLLEEISNSDALYFITTSFPISYTNAEIEPGEWRPIDITKEPFNFNFPFTEISEGYSGWGSKKSFKDKSIYVFNLGESK